MRDDARELHRDHAQHGAARWHLDSEQPLRTDRERDVVADRVEIVLAIGPRDYLVVLPILADLLEAAVQIADVRNAAHHRLAVELEHEAQHAVRCRMLRSDVDQHVLARELGRRAKRRRLERRDGSFLRDRHRRSHCATVGVDTGGAERDFHRSRLGGHPTRLSVRRRRGGDACLPGDPRTPARRRAPPWSSGLPS